ncbi:MAG: PqqD family protein [Candidatus Thermoplasmatota archaeon]|nr:PqqD family protein [Candidatus Thermoplasmatota archaeon]
MSKEKQAKEIEGRTKAEQENAANEAKKIEAVLAMVPIKADLKWEDANGITVIYLKKNFSKFERTIHKVVGGPDTVRIPLDKYGTEVWALCDGKNTIKQICETMWEKYKEEMEGVQERIPKFLSLLRSRGLIYFEHEKAYIIPPNADKK